MFGFHMQSVVRLGLHMQSRHVGLRMQSSSNKAEGGLNFAHNFIIGDSLVLVLQCVLSRTVLK
jgi:hypothetical protein